MVAWTASRSASRRRPRPSRPRPGSKAEAASRARGRRRQAAPEAVKTDRGLTRAAVSAELRVSLLQHTPDPDRAVAIAGRLCYAPVSAADLQQDMSDEDVAKLVRVLVRCGHHSALEHASFSFAVDGVSRRLHAPARAAPRGQLQPAVAALRELRGGRQLHRPAQRRRPTPRPRRSSSRPWSTRAWPTTGSSSSAWPRAARARACRRTRASCCPTPPRPRSSSP